MGNRSHIIIHDGTEVGPIVYQHWSPCDAGIIEQIENLGDYMAKRKGDIDYATARLIGMIHADGHDGEFLSLGVSNAPVTELEKLKEHIRDKMDWMFYDEGVWFVDCNDFSFERLTRA